MTSPLSPEAVAQMVQRMRMYAVAWGERPSVSPYADTAPGLTTGRVIIDTGSAADMLTTLAAENATLRAERDAMQQAQTYSYIGKDMKTVKAVDLENERDALRASEAAALERVKVLEDALNGCIAAIEHADMADGVCCCGDNMDGHSNPMNCGHSPVDMGEYHAHQVLTAARAAISLPIGTATEKTNG